MMSLTVRRLLCTCLVAAAVAMAGCQTLPSTWTKETRKSIDSNMEDARSGKAPDAVPADVGKSLLPPVEIALPNGKVTTLEPRFDLTINNAPARQVFMGLVEGSKYSVVVHPDVRGALSLNLKEVTVPEAFQSIRRVYGYEYTREGDRFLVGGREMQSRMFNVNYLNLVRKGRSDTRVTASGLTSTGFKSGSGTGAGTTTTTTQSGVQIETQSQSDFWKELNKAVAALIGCDIESKVAGAPNSAGDTSLLTVTCHGGRRAIVNPETGVVIVRAMPDELRLVEEYLGATHTAVNRQVVLEAKIIEVELNDGFQTGINWSRLQDGKVTFAQTGGGKVFGTPGTIGPSDTAGNTGDLNPGSLFSAISGTTASAFGGVFSLAAKTANFAAFVELLKSQGEVQVLSSPRISTVNNQKAVIKVGADAFFVTKQDVTVTTGTSQITTELTPFFSGISLDVTPQIDENGNITLHIHPAISSVTEKKISTGRISDTLNNEVSTAFSSIQESDNIVRVGSGQVVVIGGLMKEGSTDENASVPFLGDIPIIGNLFKHKKVTRIKKELVILLKPTVIHLDQDWNKEIDESQDRIKKIRVGS